MSEVTPANKESSRRQILRSGVIVGGASVINILIGLVRMKVVAVLLGPAGVGLVGILQNVMATASTVSALGFGNASTRQIAEAHGRGDQVGIDTTRRALFWATLFLAAAGGGAIWALRELVAAEVLDNPGMASDIGWLGIGVAFAVVAGSQYGLLSGMRRIGDIAKVSLHSSLLGTVVGITLIYWLGKEGIIWFVVVTPLASFLMSHLYVAKLPDIVSGPTPLRVLAGKWKTFARLGTAFMIAGLATIVGQLVVRILVQAELGSEDLGYFQAAWAISMISIGFVHSAMNTDYYPRLTAAIHDRQQANLLVNEQTEVAILLAGPVLLGILALAPWVLQLLYSDEFVPAANVLRWQILGAVLKAASWTLGFIIISAGHARLFMLAEMGAVTVFVLVTWLALPYTDIEATGMGFFAMHLFYLPFVYWLGYVITGLHWAVPVVKDVLILFVLAVIIAIAGHCRDWLGAAVGLVVALAYGCLSLIRLARMAELGGSVGKLAVKASRLVNSISKVQF